jgi:hypothetical protein
VDSYPQSGASQLTGRDADTAFRLLNVAISRARGKLVVLADVKFIRERHSRSSPSRTILRLLQEQGQTERAHISVLRKKAGIEGITWYDKWAEAESSLAQDVRGARRSLIVNLPEKLDPKAIFFDALARSSAVCSQVILFGPARVAEQLENTTVDLRLMIQPGGMFAFVDDYLVWIGSYSPDGAMARVENPDLGKALQKLLLVSTKLPRPNAEAERTLAKIGGRCPQCGENRTPRRKPRAGWVMGCSRADHDSLSVDVPLLAEIAKALQVRCPDCQKIAVVRTSGKNLFLGCPEYARGCRGKPPGLEDIFRGD